MSICKRSIPDWDKIEKHEFYNIHLRSTNVFFSLSVSRRARGNQENSHWNSCEPWNTQIFLGETRSLERVSVSCLHATHVATVP